MSLDNQPQGRSWLSIAMDSIMLPRYWVSILPIPHVWLMVFREDSKFTKMDGGALFAMILLTEILPRSSADK